MKLILSEQFSLLPSLLYMHIETTCILRIRYGEEAIFRTAIMASLIEGGSLSGSRRANSSRERQTWLGYTHYFRNEPV